MKTKSITLGLVIAALFTACSGVQVVSDSNPDADFSNYHTYALVNATDADEPQSVLNNPINMGRLENELHKNLSERGLEESAAPDVVIKYAVTQGERTGYRGTTTDMGGAYYGRWGRGWYGGPTMSTTQVDQYEVPTGTATIAIEDAESGELLWYTTAAGDLKINQKNVGKGIPKAVEMLMESFPIQGTRDSAGELPV